MIIWPAISICSASTVIYFLSEGPKTGIGDVEEMCSKLYGMIYICVALQYDFSDHLMDDEVKNLIRARKQGFNEPFEEYYSEVLRICDRLRTIIPDPDMVGMLKRGLRPHTLNKKLILKEMFLLEDKFTNLKTQLSQMSPRKKFPK